MGVHAQMLRHRMGSDCESAGGTEQSAFIPGGACEAGIACSIMNRLLHFQAPDALPPTTLQTLLRP